MFAEEEGSRLGSLREIQDNTWYEKRHPYVGGIELTPYCNLRCVHCYLQDQNNKEQKLLTTEQVKVIIDKLYNAGVLFLYFTGGEIFTRSDFLEIYVYAKKKGFILELLTNGTLIDERVLEVFREFPPASISISMYGGDEVSYERVTGRKGMYDKVIRTFVLLNDSGIHFEIKYIGMKENEEDFLKVKKVAEVFGAVFSYSMELFPTLLGDSCPKNHMMELEKIVKTEMLSEGYAEEILRQASVKNSVMHKTKVPLYMCDMAVSNFLIDYQGFINPCHKSRIKKWNILSCSMQEAWDDFGSYRNEVASKYNKCVRCEYLMMCSPCVLVNKLTTGDENIPSDTVCKLTHMRVVAARRQVAQRKKAASRKWKSF
jgi:radical SAM protein with 4Fe4S-binding SPASM domain